MRQLRFESERRLALVATSAVFVPNMLFFVNDRIVAHDRTQLARLYALRIALFAAWGVGLLLLRACRTRERLRWLIFALAMTIVVFTLALHLARPADTLLSTRTSTVMALLIFVVYPNPWRLQVIPWGVLFFGTWAILQWHNVGIAPVEKYSILMIMVFGGGLGLLVAHNRRTLEREMTGALDRERAAIDERERVVADLRTLEGILPICSHCHKVRTEVGDWQGLDRYVRARTSAEFSHGICPDCAREHYPDLYDETPTT